MPTHRQTDTVHINTNIHNTQHFIYHKHNCIMTFNIRSNTIHSCYPTPHIYVIQHHTDMLSNTTHMLSNTTHTCHPTPHTFIQLIQHHIFVCSINQTHKHMQHFILYLFLPAPFSPLSPPLNFGYHELKLHSPLTRTHHIS